MFDFNIIKSSIKIKSLISGLLFSNNELLMFKGIWYTSKSCDKLNKKKGSEILFEIKEFLFNF